MAAPGMSCIVAVSVSLYRRCLRAYPIAFRRAYGGEMAQLFRDSCRESYGRAGTWGVLSLWLSVLADLILSAFSERIAALRYRRGEVMMLTHERSGRLLWIEWICAGAVGWGLAALISALVNDILIDIMRPSMQGVGLVQVATQGAVLALIQWLVVRRYLRRADHWAWATAGTVALAMGAIVIGVRGPLPAQEWTYDRIILLEGVVVGAAQWLVLRPHVARAGWWIAASALGWPTAVIAEALVYGSVARMVGPVGVRAGWFVAVVMLGATLGGGLYGALLGRVLVALLRRAQPVRAVS